jgi:hypothetical protein
MDNLKLVKILLISLLLQGVLLLPRITIWILSAGESALRILKETVEALTNSLKKEVLK